jgi:hypothetical protein
MNTSQTQSSEKSGDLYAPATSMLLGGGGVHMSYTVPLSPRPTRHRWAAGVLRVVAGAGVAVSALVLTVAPESPEASDHLYIDIADTSDRSAADARYWHHTAGKHPQGLRPAGANRVQGHTYRSRTSRDASGPVRHRTAANTPHRRAVRAAGRVSPGWHHIVDTRPLL